MSNLLDPASSATSIHVLAGVILRSDGKVLVAQRPEGKSFAGAWEFPGGKRERGEERLAALVRECEEELGIQVRSARPLIRYKHHYPELTVDLDAWLISAWTGKTQGNEGQRLGWYRPEELMALGLLPADGVVLSALRLPSLCAVTPKQCKDEEAFLDELEILAGKKQVPLVVFRRPDLESEVVLALAVAAVNRIDGTLTQLQLHGDPARLAPWINAATENLIPRLSSVVAGLHIPGKFLDELDERPLRSVSLFGVSCHDGEQLKKALTVNADYAFLGPVKPTTSHPGEPGMGWDMFESLVRELPLPVYAIGGLGPEHLAEAWAHGAQGIAAIRSLWPG